MTRTETRQKLINVGIRLYKGEIPYSIADILTEDILKEFEENLTIPVSSLTLKGKHKKLFRTWKMYLEKTPNNTYLINEKEYLESELVTVYKEIMID